MMDSFDIEEQQRFVAWLKERGMYNQFDSAQVMQKAHAVWAVQQDLINKHVKFIESLRDTLIRGGEEFKEQEQRIVELEKEVERLERHVSYYAGKTGETLID